jgi:uncharacterized membrane protein
MISFSEISSSLTLVTALGSGIIGGVFFAFSTFIMKSLGRLPSHEGIAAMQAINVDVVRGLFLPVFLGTALLCIFVGITAIKRWSEPAAPYLLAGAVLYFAGTFLCTMLFNVPLNNALATLPPNGPESAARWASYVTDWTRWNHVRTIAALASSVSLVLGRS